MYVIGKLMLLTKKQAADQLLCSVRTIQRLIDAGDLRVVNLTSSTRGQRIHRDDLQAFIEGHRQWQSGNSEAEDIKLMLRHDDITSDLREMFQTKRQRSRSKQKSDKSLKSERQLTVVSSTLSRST